MDQNQTKCPKISETFSYHGRSNRGGVSEYIALLQDDVDPKNATEERHCCWQIEEVSGFVTPEKRSPAITAGGAVQIIIVYL